MAKGDRNNLVKSLRGQKTESIPADGLNSQGTTLPSLTLDMDLISGADKLAVGDEVTLTLKTKVQEIKDNEQNGTMSFKITSVSSGE